VLVIGKTLNFVRDVCQNANWFMASKESSKGELVWFWFGFLYRSEPFLFLVSSLFLYYEDVFCFEKHGLVEEAIQRTYQVSSKQLLGLLFAEYDLPTHFSSLRKYLLLGQGDFANYLLQLIA